MMNNTLMNHSPNLLHPRVGYATWLAVFAISVNSLWQSAALIEAILLQLLILACLVIVSVEKSASRFNKWQPFALWLMLLTILALGWHVVMVSLFIYSIMWITIAPHHLSSRTCWLMLVVISIAWYLIRVYSWQDNNAFTDTILVAAFHAFGLVSALSSIASQHANERTQELNRELIATQHLLSEASKENERTRIARDLHDLLGHHLTALTINLQVASHLTEGEAQEKVSQCHGLAKLLLSDVREAVSTLRETPLVSLRTLLHIATKDVPKLDVELDVKNDVELDDVNTAEILLRSVQEAITNSLRHSDATKMQIRAEIDKLKIRLNIIDDGQPGAFTGPGNGLAGMRERIEAAGGTLKISGLVGFPIAIELPMTQQT